MLDQITPLGPGVPVQEYVPTQSATNNLASNSSAAVDGGGGILGKVIDGVADIATSVLSNSVGGVPFAASGNFAELINLQIQAQQEMQTTSMISNVEHSKHESKMAAIRNMRVG